MPKNDTTPREFAVALPREMASVERETAEARTFTEDEHTAILADRIKQETAALETAKAELAEQVEALVAEKAELQTKVDLLESEKATLESEFATYKGEIERKAEVAARREERIAKVRESAPHLKDDFFTPERADRFAEMETAAFDAYLADMGATAPSAGAAPKTPARETAMSGAQVQAPEAKTATGNSFFNKFKGA